MHTYKLKRARYSKWNDKKYWGAPKYIQTCFERQQVTHLNIATPIIISIFQYLSQFNFEYFFFFVFSKGKKMCQY